jgi:protein-disulfide isomerase
MISRQSNTVAKTVRISTLVVATLFLAGCYGQAGNGVSTTIAASPNYSVDQDDHTMGNSKAPITMIEYFAPGSVHSAKFHMTVFPQLKSGYIDAGKVYFVFRVFPMTAADVAMESIAHCLPADKYFQFIDLVFRNQPKWDPEFGVTDVRGGLIQMARIVGMSSEKVDECISNTDEQDRINRVAQDGEEKYKIQGVPTFVINGVAFLGAEDWPQMRAKLDALLSKPQFASRTAYMVVDISS